MRVVCQGFYCSVVFLPLCHRYEHQDIALTCGMMLRECCRHEELARIVLHSDKFYNFFTYVEMSTFDIASDAFSTFKVWQCANSAQTKDYQFLF